MKKEIQTLDELIADIADIKADLEWAKNNGKKNLILYFEDCLRKKEGKLKDFESIKQF